MGRRETGIGLWRKKESKQRSNTLCPVQWVFTVSTPRSTMAARSAVSFCRLSSAVCIYICIYRWIETTKEQGEGGGDGAVRGELPHNLSGLFNRSSEKERARLRVSCFLSSFFVPI